MHLKTMSADPNNWVQNPPSVFVKVHGTSRDAINGKFGLVLQYIADRQRYTIVMCESQDPVSLRADNLVVCTMMEKSQAYYQMMRNNPDVQRNIQQFTRQVQQRTGLSPQYALGIGLLAIVVTWYQLGFSKMLLIVTAIIMALTVIGPDLAAGRDIRAILRAAPSRWREVVRTQVPMIGNRIASSQIYLGAFTAFLVFFFVYSLVSSPAARSSAANKGYSATGESYLSNQPNSRSLEDLKDRYYKLGFDDATNARVYGASLASDGSVDSSTVAMDGSTSSTSPPLGIPGADAGTADDPYAWRSTDASRGSYYDSASQSTSSGMFNRSPKKKSPFNVSSALALFTLVATLRPLAINAEGNLDLPLLRANLTTLDSWKLGIIAFSVYRLVAAFI